MKTVSTMMLFLLGCGLYLTAQTEGDKEIIIIEKSYDQDGNEISRSTKRWKGTYTEEQIQEYLEGDDLPGPSLRSYDMDGMGYEDEMRSYFGGSRDARPTLGLHLDFEMGSAEVASVLPGSGASKADIRPGDILLTINSMSIATIDDVYEVLDNRAIGDKVRVKIFRDGQEIEKDITLGAGKSNFSFLMPGENGEWQNLFGDDSGTLPMHMDSLLSLFFENGDIFQQFDINSDFDFLELFDGLNSDMFDQLRIDRRGSSELFEGQSNLQPQNKDRAALGVFLEDNGAGVVITGIVDNSPAAAVDLREGDKILRMDDNMMSTYMEISAYMNRKKVGDNLQLEIERDGVIKEINVKL